MELINQNGIVLVGCGFMGQALLSGWLNSGVLPTRVTVLDPSPSDWVRAQHGVRINVDLPKNPAVIVIATKPQILADALPKLAGACGPDTVVVSIAAGAQIALFEETFGANTPILRAMPNLPACVGAGATGIYANRASSPENIALIETLFSAVGTSVTLPDENMLHAVTGLSGSGPAYVFAMAEAMIQAAIDTGLPAELARDLAVQTLVGAGKILAAPDADPKDLRIAVTSKGGTTAAGLDQFLHAPDGIKPLVKRTVDAARRRSIALSQTS